MDSMPNTSTESFVVQESFAVLEGGRPGSGFEVAVSVARHAAHTHNRDSRDKRDECRDQPRQGCAHSRSHCQHHSKSQGTAFTGSQDLVLLVFLPPSLLHFTIFLFCWSSYFTNLKEEGKIRVAHPTATAGRGK